MKVVNNLTLLIIILFYLFAGCKPNNTIIIPFDAKAKADSAFFLKWNANPNFSSGQNAFSLALPNGKILWLFGNSHLADKVAGKVPCNFAVQNAGVIQENNIYTTLNSGNTNLIPNIGSESLQPTCAYLFVDTIFVYCKKNEWGYLSMHQSYIAKFLYPSLQYLTTDSITHFSNAIVANCQFGLATAADSLNGYAYEYGYIPSPINGSPKIIIGRHSLDSPHKSWKYFDGVNWVDDFTKSNFIFTTVNNAQVTSIRRCNKAYVAISQDIGIGCGKGTNIYSHYAAEPWGPFNGERKLFTIPEQYLGFSPNTIGATLQPSFVDANKKVLITYSLNGYNDCTNDCENNFTDPLHWSTYAFTVPMNAINPAW